MKNYTDKKITKENNDPRKPCEAGGNFQEGVIPRGRDKSKGGWIPFPNCGKSDLPLGLLFNLIMKCILVRKVSKVMIKILF